MVKQLWFGTFNFEVKLRRMLPALGIAGQIQISSFKDLKRFLLLQVKRYDSQGSFYLETFIVTSSDDGLQPNHES